MTTDLVMAVKRGENWFCDEFAELIDDYGQEVCIYEYCSDYLFRGREDEEGQYIRHPDLIGTYNCLISQTTTQSIIQNTGKRGLDGRAIQEVECLFRRGDEGIPDKILKPGQMFTTSPIISGVNASDRLNSDCAGIKYRLVTVSGLVKLWHCAVIKIG